MIKKLQNSDLETAKRIRSIFKDSYAVEAKLLNAIDFPPLKRPLDDYLKDDTEFFGYTKNEELAGIIEISHQQTCTYICSLVVAPRFFKQRIASKLMEFTLLTFDSDVFMVETGLENEPATRLYKNFGFIEVKQWDTNHGIRKIKFELRINN